MAFNVNTPAIHLGEEEWLQIIRKLPQSSIDSLLSTCKRIEESSKNICSESVHYFNSSSDNQPMSLDNANLLTPETLTNKSSESDLSLSAVYVDNRRPEPVHHVQNSFKVENLDFSWIDETDSIRLAQNDLAQVDIRKNSTATYLNAPVLLMKPVQGGYNSLSTLASAAVALAYTNTPANDSENSRRERRRERNRVAAAKCRQNRQIQIEKLQERVKDLREIQKELKYHIQQVEAERANLEYNLQEHASLGCTASEQYLKRFKLTAIWNSISGTDNASSNYLSSQSALTSCTPVDEMKISGIPVLSNLGSEAHVVSTDYNTVPFPQLTSSKTVVDLADVDGRIDALMDSTVVDLPSLTLQQNHGELLRSETEHFDGDKTKYLLIKNSQAEIYRTSEVENFATHPPEMKPTSPKLPLKLALPLTFQELKRPSSLQLREQEEFETIPESDYLPKGGPFTFSSLLSNGGNDLSAIITPCTEKWLATEIGKSLFSPQLTKLNATVVPALGDSSSLQQSEVEPKIDNILQQNAAVDTMQDS